MASPGTLSGPGLISKEFIERMGYEPICAPTFKDTPGCENHRHLAGQRKAT